MSEEMAEVVDVKDEEIEQARHLPAVQASEAMVVRDEVTPSEVAEQRDKIKQVMAAVMTPEVHYGTIPGVNKPTLLKPGAEVLAVTLRLAPRYSSERMFHDDGHLTVVSKVTLVHITSGLTIAEGEGLCTSREKKYAKRKAERVCPNCGAHAIIKGKADYGGGWVCWKKKEGCGQNFPDGDESIESQSIEDVDNPELADTFNTVLKMANKRALIAAILNGTAASDIFTQDVEDNDDRQAQASVRQEREPIRQEKPPVKVPRSNAEVLERMGYAIEFPEVWLGQAREVCDNLPDPTLFQRLCGLVLDVEEKSWSIHSFPLATREEIQDAFAARFDGLVLSGPQWALTSEEAEAGRPSYEEVNPESAEDPS